MTEEAPPPDAGPTLRLVRGDAAPEEIAALLAVLSARSASSASTSAPEATRRGWADPARALTRTPRPGPGAWRSSGAPR